MASTPAKSRTPARKGTPGTPNRDTLVKVTFSVRHGQEIPNTDMFVTGSLPMLGSWDARRARKLARAEDGTWNLAVYIPDRVEFMYQYLLVVANEDPAAQPDVVWTGQLERKCRVEDAASTPKGKQLLLDDNTAGDAAVDGTPAARQMIKFDPLMPALNKETLEQKLEVKQVEIDQLLEERERAQNELQKLKDIVGSVDNPDDYRKRQSYLPDCSSQLYDTVRDIQAKVQRKLQRAQECAIISEEGGDSNSTQTVDEMNVALNESETKCTDLRERLEETEERLREMQAAHEAEKVELRDYYQNAMGTLDTNQKLDADARIKEEENKTMLQSSVRLVAGQLDDIKTSYTSLKDLMQQLRSAFVPPSPADAHFAVAGASVAHDSENMEMEEDAAAVGEEETATTEGFARVAEEIGRSVEGVTGVLEEAMTEVKGKLKKEVTERKRLHNLVQELRGNIRVFCRVRPLSKKNIADGAKAAVGFPSDTDISVDVGGKMAAFQFDRVFDSSSTQEQVFEETQPLVVSVLDGYNVCIFAYGQTGSGKTHTMQGYGGDTGVNTRALEQLFVLAHEREGVYTYDIKVSLLEIYNETIRDLVDPKDAATGDDKKLDVKIAPEGGTTVPGMASTTVQSMEDVMALLATGERNRSVGCTNMNEHSSRSHMILSIHSCGTNCVTGVKGYGKLHLIDLAGSERVGKSGATGDRLKEAQNINKSLSALGDCVQSLVSKSKHVPFRNSKLTYLLQDSLGGESKALMLVCASPCVTDASETACSLNFASRVRNVELGPAKRKGGTDVVTEMKMKDKDRELEAVREEKKKLESGACKMESRFKELQQQVQEAQDAQAAALMAAAAAGEGVEGSDGAELAALLAQKDAEIASLRTQLESGGGGDVLNLSTGSAESAVGGCKGGRGGGSVASADNTMIPRLASSRTAPAAVNSGRKRAPPVSTDGIDDADSLQSPAKKRASGNKENMRATPSRGARTPAKSRSTPAKTVTASLDDRLAQLRQSRQEQQQHAAPKSVGFAGSTSSCDTSSSMTRARPMTAPARAGSRLAAGAARVTAKPAARAAAPTPSAARRAGRAGVVDGGWR